MRFSPVGIGIAAAVLLIVFVVGRAVMDRADRETAAKAAEPAGRAHRNLRLSNDGLGIGQANPQFEDSKP